jgi:hypothetical protein
MRRGAREPGSPPFVNSTPAVSSAYLPTCLQTLAVSAQIKGNV